MNTTTALVLLDGVFDSPVDSQVNDEPIFFNDSATSTTETETREMIYKYVAFGSFKQSKVQPCRHKTSLCPDRCTHAQKLYVFTLTDISTSKMDLHQVNE